jgi:hypothetical protein
MKSECMELWSTPIAQYTLENISVHENIVHRVFHFNPSDNLDGTQTNIITDGIFKDWVLDCVNNYCERFLGDFNSPVIDRGWCISQKQYECNEMHSHAPFHIAAVYYINANDGHPELEITDPRPPHVFNIVFRKQNDGKLGGGYRSIKIKAKTGNLVLFPGYLLHGVGTNLLEEPRICVAMNVNVKRK